MAQSMLTWHACRASARPMSCARKRTASPGSSPRRAALTASTSSQCVYSCAHQHNSLTQLADTSHGLRHLT